MRATLTALAFFCGAGCTAPLSGPAPVGDVGPVVIGGNEAPPGGGLGPDEHGGGVNSGFYPLSAVCRMLLSSPKIPAGVCSNDAKDFILPDTGYILDDPNDGVCGTADTDIAYAVDECFAAACDGQLHLDDFAATHAMNAQMYVSDAEALCAGAGPAFSGVHCTFADVWSCP